MVIKHNMFAINANRQLGITTNQLSSKTEKLSSGYKINRAADDAAGLSISEKMRKQIRGLSQASLNAEDGISYVQTTEGALNEVHDMLQRGRELAVQAANGTNSDAERTAIQNELDQLKTEIERVGATTKFNEKFVFDNDSTAGGTHIVSPFLLGGVDAVIMKEYIPPKILVENDYAGSAAGVQTSGATPTAAQMQDFANLLASDKVPKILGSLQGTVFNGVNPTGGSPIVLGLDLYVGGQNGTLAYLKSNGMGFELAVNTSYLQSDASGNVLWNEDLATTIAHELTHGIMFDMVTNGMLGVDGADSLPEWFVEGAAQVVGGAMNYVNSSQLTSASSIANYMKTLENGGYNSYAQGYLAAAYIGYVAGGETSVDSATIASGLNKILKDIADGYSLGQAISIETNGKYAGLSDFTSKIEHGDSDAVNFITAFRTAVGSGAGSAALGSLSSGKSDLTSGGTGSYFTLDVAKDYSTSLTANRNAFNTAGVNPYTGGGATTTSGKRRNGTTNPDAKAKWEDANEYSVPYSGGAISLHVGADADGTNKIMIKKLMLTAESLRLDQVDVMSEDSATESLKKYDFAISVISATRSYLGAIQNRLEHTIKNLDNVVENTTDSESKIRDTDMAKTMVDYSNLNILANVGQSMLAQSNQANQSVLSLVK